MFEDDAYFYLQFGERIPSLWSLDTDGRVLRFDSLSKIMSAGLRLGWVTGHPELIEQIEFAMQAAALQASSLTQMLVAASELIGYFVAMKGVDEVHLLNVTVAPQYQKQGWGRILLDALALWARGQGAQWLWLEVRASNGRAQQVYAAHGYQRVGERKGYYPATKGAREDAVVMNLQL